MNNRKYQQAEFSPVYTSGPPVLVYKTKAVYKNYVPVILSSDKQEIVSYPHPSDVKTGKGLLIPTKLHNGYLLDNKGIGKNVAFLKMTYEEYSKLEKLPSLKELFELIIDKDPLLELCDCGSKSAFVNVTKQLNSLIDKKVLRTKCKEIK
ncbi:MAG: hypothetical protein ACOYOA_16890 [Saprospiraceae bacterium]